MRTSSSTNQESGKCFIGHSPRSGYTKMHESCQELKQFLRCCREREREESSSRLRTTGANSQLSQQIASATSTSWVQTKAGHEPSLDGGHLDHRDFQHDLSSNSDKDDSRLSNARGIEADPDASPLDAMTPPPPPPAQCSSTSPSNSPSGSSLPTAFSTSAPPGDRPGASPEDDPDGRAVEHGDSRGVGNSPAARPSPHGAGATDQGSTEAILMSSPSNRTRFAALAVALLPDLHALDPAGRVMTRCSW